MSKNTETRNLLKLGIPISIGMIAGMVMQIVDTMFVGRISPEALGGVSLGTSLFSVCFVTGIGIASSLDYLVSKDVGAKKWDECKHWLWNGFLIILAYSFPIIFLVQNGVLFLRLFNIEENILFHTNEYLKVLAWGLPLFLIYLLVQKYLQAYQRIKSAMIIIIIANILNAIANYVLVFGNFGFTAYGVKGSAYATNISRVFMTVLLVVDMFVFDAKNGRSWKNYSFKAQVSKMKEIIRIGIPTSIQLLLEVGVFALSTFIAGKLGAVSLSAHQIVLQIASFTFMIPLGLSSAASVLVGNAIGEINKPLAILRGNSAFKLGLILMAFIGAILFIALTPILKLFTNHENIIATAKSLIILAAFFQIFDSTQVIGAGVIRGTGNTRSSMIANFIGHWIIGLPIGIFLCFKLNYGIQGIWIGLTMGLMVVAILLYWIWRLWIQEQKSDTPL